MARNVVLMLLIVGVAILNAAVWVAGFPNHLESEIETIRWTHAGAFAWNPRKTAHHARSAINRLEEQKTRNRRAVKLKENSIRLNRYRQLFIDNYLVDEMHSIRHNIQAAEKHPTNPIVHGDHH